MVQMAQLDLPPGFRFHPTDSELVGHYLKRKLEGKPIKGNLIREINLLDYEPWELPDFSLLEDGEWYFFCPRDRKYPNGHRTNRATGRGYWKATGKDKPVKQKKKQVGMKKTLVFYEGRAPQGIRSNWIMHEYRVEEEGRATGRTDAFVLCRVYNKSLPVENDDEGKMAASAAAAFEANSSRPGGAEQKTVQGGASAASVGATHVAPPGSLLSMLQAPSPRLAAALPGSPLQSWGHTEWDGGEPDLKDMEEFFSHADSLVSSPALTTDGFDDSLHDADGLGSVEFEAEGAAGIAAAAAAAVPSSSGGLSADDLRLTFFSNDGGDDGDDFVDTAARAGHLFDRIDAGMDADGGGAGMGWGEMGGAPGLGHGLAPHHPLPLPADLSFDSTAGVSLDLDVDSWPVTEADASWPMVDLHYPVEGHLAAPGGVAAAAVAGGPCPEVAGLNPEDDEFLRMVLENAGGREETGTGRTGAVEDMDLLQQHSRRQRSTAIMHSAPDLLAPAGGRIGSGGIRIRQRQRSLMPAQEKRAGSQASLVGRRVRLQMHGGGSFFDEDAAADVTNLGDGATTLQQQRLSQHDGDAHEKKMSVQQVKEQEIADGEGDAATVESGQEIATQLRRLLHARQNRHLGVARGMMPVRRSLQRRAAAVVAKVEMPEEGWNHEEEASHPRFVATASASVAASVPPAVGSVSEAVGVGSSSHASTSATHSQQQQVDMGAHPYPPLPHSSRSDGLLVAGSGDSGDGFDAWALGRMKHHSALHGGTVPLQANHAAGAVASEGDWGGYGVDEDDENDGDEVREVEPDAAVADAAAAAAVDGARVHDLRRGHERRRRRRIGEGEGAQPGEMAAAMRGGRHGVVAAVHEEMQFYEEDEVMGANYEDYQEQQMLRAFNGGGVEGRGAAAGARLVEGGVLAGHHQLMEIENEAIGEHFVLPAAPAAAAAAAFAVGLPAGMPAAVAPAAAAAAARLPLRLRAREQPFQRHAAEGDNFADVIAVAALDDYMPKSMRQEGGRSGDATAALLDSDSTRLVYSSSFDDKPEVSTAPLIELDKEPLHCARTVPIADIVHKMRIEKQERRERFVAASEEKTKASRMPPSAVTRGTRPAGTLLDGWSQGLRRPVAGIVQFLADSLPALPANACEMPREMMPRLASENVPSQKAKVARSSFMELLPDQQSGTGNGKVAKSELLDSADSCCTFRGSKTQFKGGRGGARTDATMMHERVEVQEESSFSKGAKYIFWGAVACALWGVAAVFL